MSGIGPTDVLSAAGVPVRVDMPSVGERMREHRCFVNQYRLKDNLGYNARLATKSRQTWEGVKYLATRRGPLSLPCFDVIGFVKTDPSLERPDGQIRWVRSLSANRILASESRWRPNQAFRRLASSSDRKAKDPSGSLQ